MSQTQVLHWASFCPRRIRTEKWEIQRGRCWSTPIAWAERGPASQDNHRTVRRKTIYPTVSSYVSSPLTSSMAALLQPLNRTSASTERTQRGLDSAPTQQTFQTWVGTGQWFPTEEQTRQTPRQPPLTVCRASGRGSQAGGALGSSWDEKVGLGGRRPGQRTSPERSTGRESAREQALETAGGSPPPAPHRARRPPGLWSAGVNMHVHTHTHTHTPHARGKDQPQAAHRRLAGPGVADVHTVLSGEETPLHEQGVRSGPQRGAPLWKQHQSEGLLW